MLHLIVGAVLDGQNALAQLLSELSQPRLLLALKHGDQEEYDQDSAYDGRRERQHQPLNPSHGANLHFSPALACILSS